MTNKMWMSFFVNLLKYKLLPCVSRQKSTELGTSENSVFRLTVKSEKIVMLKLPHISTANLWSLVGWLRVNKISVNFKCLFFKFIFCPRREKGGRNCSQFSKSLHHQISSGVGGWGGGWGGMWKRKGGRLAQNLSLKLLRVVQIVIELPILPTLIRKYFTFKAVATSRNTTDFKTYS